MDPRINLYEEYDLEDIARYSYNKRIKLRTDLIHSFLKKSKKESYKNIGTPFDSIAVENANNYRLYLYIVAGGSNFIMYKLFFDKVVNINSFYWNPKSVPLYIRLSITTVLSLIILRLKWRAFIYNPEFYRLAVKEQAETKISNN